MAAPAPGPPPPTVDTAEDSSDRHRRMVIERRMGPPLSYNAYLQIPKLLECQSPVTRVGGLEAHDEHLFIIIHQTYELWFKQVLWELGSVAEIFSADTIPETSMFTVVSRLTRVTEIFRVLVEQVRILETMSPLNFLEFRDVLFPASGFQSVQFRLFENLLGLRPEDRLSYGQKGYCSYLSAEDAEVVKKSESKRSLFELVQSWLERTPFLEMGDFNFWGMYRDAVERMHEQDCETLRSYGMPDSSRAEQEAGFAASKKHFDVLFDEAEYQKLLLTRHKRLSYKAMKAALFVHMYCEEPVFNLPSQILSLLVEIDKLVTQWRVRHAIMVHGMLGLKMGTGGSSGYFYLMSTAERHQVFKDLTDMSTFLIPKYDLPTLPEDVVARMRRHFLEQKQGTTSTHSAKTHDDAAAAPEAK